MNFTEIIHDKVRKIRELIKKARIEDALNEIEKFIEEIGDKELDKEIITLTARYNQEEKEKRLGIKSDYENQNKIIYAMFQILNETKEIAIEKATLNTEKELDKSKVEPKTTKFIITIDDDKIDEFKKERINDFIRALSRLLEIKEEDILIESVYEGSIKVVLSVPSHTSERLVSLFKEGLLSKYKIIDCQEKEDTINKTIIFLYEKDEVVRISIKGKINDKLRSEIFIIKDFVDIKSLQNAIYNYFPDIFIVSTNNEEYQSLSEVLNILSYTGKTDIIFLVDDSLEKLTPNIYNEFSPIRILIKPFNLESLFQILENSLSRKTFTQRPFILKNHIFLYKDGAKYGINSDDIILVESDSGAIKIYVHDSEKVEIFTLPTGISQFESQLNKNIDNKNLIRVHARFIVNTKFIKSYTRGKKEITLNIINRVIPLSERIAKQLYNDVSKRE